jgi:hypothetical protein
MEAYSELGNPADANVSACPYQRSVVLSVGDIHNRPCDEPVHEKTAGASFFAD